MRAPLDRFLEILLQLLMVVMVLSALLQVGGRAIDINVQFTEELTVYSMMWVAFLGAAYGFGLKKHIAIELLAAYLTAKGKKRLQYWVDALIASFALLVLVMGGGRLVYITLRLNQISAVLQVPKGWIYMVLPLSGVLIITYCILNVMNCAKEGKQ